MKNLKEKTPGLGSVKETLLQRKADLEEEFISLQTDKYDDQAQDPADQAASAIFETLQNSLQNNELEEYKMIIKALEMIEQGTYGQCIDCDQKIAERRLQSFPNASRCVGCQEKAEETNHHNDNYF